MVDLPRKVVVSVVAATLCSTTSSATVGDLITTSSCADEVASDECGLPLQVTLLQRKHEIVSEVVDATSAGGRAVAKVSKERVAKGGGTIERMGAHPPLTWFHPPRTGSSFAYSLVTFEDLCEKGVLKKQASDYQPVVGEMKHLCRGIYVPDICDDDERVWARCAEYAIGRGTYPLVEGGLVGMFRDPAVRITSDWSWVCGTNPSCDIDLLTWAQQHEGCVTGLLLHEGDVEHCQEFKTPTPEELAMAKVRVRTGFAFIGLTDEWNLSICLFNAMFAAPCHSRQFASYSKHVGEAYDTSALAGFVDRFDTELWEIAQEIFQTNLLKYNVSATMCSQSRPCFD